MLSEPQVGEGRSLAPGLAPNYPPCHHKPPATLCFVSAARQSFGAARQSSEPRVRVQCRASEFGAARRLGAACQRFAASGMETRRQPYTSLPRDYRDRARQEMARQEVRRQGRERQLLKSISLVSGV